jgi:hypothetical protein
MKPFKKRLNRFTRSLLFFTMLLIGIAVNAQKPTPVPDPDPTNVGGTIETETRTFASGNSETRITVRNARGKVIRRQQEKKLKDGRARVTRVHFDPSEPDTSDVAFRETNVNGDTIYSEHRRYLHGHRVIDERKWLNPDGTRIRQVDLDYRTGKYTVYGQPLPEPIPDRAPVDLNATPPPPPRPPKPPRRNGWVPKPRSRLMIGYNYLNLDNGDERLSVALGGTINYSYQLNEHLALSAEATGNWKKEEEDLKRMWGFLLFGVDYLFLHDAAAARPFVSLKAGLGCEHLKVADYKNSSSAFAALIGVGVDFRLSDAIDLRVQTGFVPTWFNDDLQSNFRAGVGANIRFGGGRFKF